MRQPSELPPTPDGNPAEGRPDLKLPGADHPDQADLPYPDKTPGVDRRPPDGPDSDVPGSINPGEPDLVPDVEVPDETM